MCLSRTKRHQREVMIERVTCNKSRKGQLEYEIDYQNRKLRIAEDKPENGFIGAAFDHRFISFDTINRVLESKSALRARDFTECFESHTGNNSGMLAAILKDLGVLVRFQNIFLVTRTL